MWQRMMLFFVLLLTVGSASAQSTPPAGWPNTLGPLTLSGLINDVEDCNGTYSLNWDPWNEWYHVEEGVTQIWFWPISGDGMMDLNGREEPTFRMHIDENQFVWVDEWTGPEGSSLVGNGSAVNRPGDSSFTPWWVQTTGAIFKFAWDWGRDRLTQTLIFMWNMWVDVIFQWIEWLFDVGRWIHWAVAFLGWLMEMLGSIMPGDVGDAIENWGAWVAEAPVQKALSLGMFFLSPLVTPVVLHACSLLVMTTWIFAMCIRVLVYGYNQVWGSSS